MSEEGGHFYLPNGTACHEILGKNGKMRPFSLRWDRHLGALPSVTTIQSVLRSPELEKWMKKKVAEACYNNPKFPNEELMAYQGRMLEAADAERNQAASEGTDIHGALEDYFHGRPYDPCIQVHVDAANKKMAEHGLVRTGSEVRVVNLAEGYAGTTDAPGNDGGGVGIIDFKGCKTKDGKLSFENKKYPMQLAAYFYGFYKREPTPGDWIANVMISRTEPGVVHVLKHDHEVIAREYEVFLHVCAVWRGLFNYDPRRSI